jgi:hypothetical protein
MSRGTGAHVPRPSRCRGGLFSIVRGTEGTDRANRLQDTPRHLPPRNARTVGIPSLERWLVASFPGVGLVSPRHRPRPSRSPCRRATNPSPIWRRCSPAADDPRRCASSDRFTQCE